MRSDNDRLVISRSDIERLRSILAAPGVVMRDREYLLELHEELDRARIVSDEDIPPDVVRLGSAVCVRDIGSDEMTSLYVVLPSQADVLAQRISVVAPLGTALLGYRTGDEVEWQMPGGTRSLLIESVRPPQPSSDPHEREHRRAAPAAA